MSTFSIGTSVGKNVLDIWVRGKQQQRSISPVRTPTTWNIHPQYHPLICFHSNYFIVFGSSIIMLWSDNHTQTSAKFQLSRFSHTAILCLTNLPVFFMLTHALSHSCYRILSNSLDWSLIRPEIRSRTNSLSL